ncbi:hypothetical protein ELI24_31605 (plasmid) [Rhizobium ruizarguesonis]|nr:MULTISPECIES: hypothetical protein [Rhizobium]MBY5714744.1 hypothetical protein [Rhizobium leguminosarum]NEH89150.1 hypothetical protein [Rhizobium ruizarguesonis]NEJ08701.1 hypothetical protein [Rhizobium ruizarguesonis]NEJ18240.1 hypothetical protein [Rhizobium ruizarguesonis]NEJ59361.1 hypothetical protein [Rhizobium ruizarguesonis]
MTPKIPGPDRSQPPTMNIARQPKYGMMAMEARKVAKTRSTDQGHQADLPTAVRWGTNSVISHMNHEFNCKVDHPANIDVDIAC